MKDLLVTITDKSSSFGRAALTAACRGHNNMGVVLNYLVYEASVEAKSKHINKDEVEYVEITRTQETILKGIHGATQSKKTINLYTKQFQEWRFVDADSYHHKYKVYFKNIQAAIDKPPPIDPPKPRGVHAKKDTANDTNGKNAISPDSKNTICNHEDEMVKMRFQMVNLASEMVKMSFEIAKLRNGQSCESAPEEASSHIFDPLESIRLLESIKENIYVSNDTLHTQFSSFSSQPSGDTNDQIHLSVNNNTDIYLSSDNATDARTGRDSASSDNFSGTHQHQLPVVQEVTNVPNTPSPTTSTRSSTPAPSGVRDNPSSIPTDPSLSPNGMEDIKDVEQISRTNDTVLHIAPVTTRKHVSKEKKRKTEQPSQKALPDLTKQEPPLSEKARVVWNIWLKMPWNKIAPKLTETAAKHCETLASVEITEEIMFKVKNFATSKKNDLKGFYQGKAWQLGNVVVEYPKWESAQMSTEEDDGSNVIPIRRMQGVARSSYDDPNYVDDTFCGQNLTLERFLVAKGAN